MRRRTWASIILLAAFAVVLARVGSAYRERHLKAGVQPASAPTAAMDAPTATIKDLMDSIVDPSADVVWNSVATTVGTSGTSEKVPQTDQEWTDVRKGAIRLVEAGNLLMMPGRHVARPGEKSENPGIELEPEEMEALVNKDRAAWEKRVQAFRAVSVEALRAIDVKDAKTLFDVGDRLDAACENCHRKYWYPNEKIPEFPSELRSNVKGGATQ